MVYGMGMMEPFTYRSLLGVWLRLVANDPSSGVDSPLSDLLERRWAQARSCRTGVHIRTHPPPIIAIGQS